jgi:hypothetical protein
VNQRIGANSWCVCQGSFVLSARANLAPVDWLMLAGIPTLIVPVLMMWQLDLALARKYISRPTHKFAALTVVSSTLIVPVAVILGVACNRAR